MKTIMLFITAFAVCMFFGCKQAGHSDHVHEGEEKPHTHDGRDQIHEQESDVQLSHEVEGHSHTGFYGEEEVKVVTLEKQEFQDILKTTGVLLPSRGDIQVYHSPANGYIHFTNERMVPGSNVGKGDVLFEITGGILSEENSDLKFREIQLEYEMEKKNFERAENLIGDKIISEGDFLAIKSKYENVKTRYQLYLENRKQGGQLIISRASGFVQQIHVSEGDYVHAGEVVAKTITQKKLILRADIPQNNYNRLSTFNSATFTTSYGNRVYRSDALHGKLLAYGRSTDETSFFTPITFEIDHHPDLIPGSFVEVNLKGNPVEDALVLPISALMEEQGKIYVFIRMEHGEFEKRYIELGIDDGEYVQVLSGLEEDQKVVVAGAYFVKLSTMSTDLPDTHSH